MEGLLEERDPRLIPKDETVDEYDIVIGRNIRNKRMKLEPRVSMEKVARYMGVSYQTVWRWEKGKSSPATRELLGLSKLFGCKPSELYEGIPGMD